MKILLLDDHSLYLNGLVRIIGDAYPASTIDSFGSIAELENQVLNIAKYDVFISDIELPSEDIFGFLQKIRGIVPELPILVISMHKKLAVIRKCKSLNVTGYILKDDDEYLLEALNCVIAKKRFYSPRIEKFYSDYQQRFIQLSGREEEVIKMMCTGYSNLIISEKLNISVETVKTHKKNIKRKVGYDQLNELIEYAKKLLII